VGHRQRGKERRYLKSQRPLLYIKVQDIQQSATPSASSPPRLNFFLNYTFRVHLPVNKDNQHLLALAMSSDLSVTWLFSHRE
jgi:hypothetical protein